MDFKKRFDDIVDFLRPLQEIWSNEVLYRYPDLQAYPKEWLSWLGNLPEKELWQIDARSNLDALKESPLNSFSNSIENLIDLPREEFHGDDLPSWAWNHVKEKKTPRNQSGKRISGKASGEKQ